MHLSATTHFAPQHDRIHYARSSKQCPLDVAGIDVEAFAGDDHLFLSSNEIEAAFFRTG